jgi:hypothetical protein
MIKFQKRQRAGYWQLRILERLAHAQHQHGWSQRDFDRYQDTLHEQFHTLIDMHPDDRVPPDLLARLERALPVLPTELDSPSEGPLP